MSNNCDTEPDSPPNPHNPNVRTDVDLQCLLGAVSKLCERSRNGHLYKSPTHEIHINRHVSFLVVFCWRGP